MADTTQVLTESSPVSRQEPTNNRMESLGRWAFVWPILIINLVVIIIPSIVGLGAAFTDWTGYNTPSFIGLQNFERLFQDDIFFTALRNNLVWTALFLTAPIAIGLLGAYMLSVVKSGQMIFRVGFFIPYVIASVVNSQLWRQLLHPRVGIGAWLGDHGIDILDFPVFGTRSTALYGVAFVDGWHFWGFLVVIYLAAMSAVDIELYEVARLDGATRFQQFRHVTLPSIRPTLIFTILMIIIWSSTTFDYVYMLTSGGPANSSEVMSTYLYDNAFSRFDAGYAAGIGMMMSLWVALAVAGFVYLRRRGWEI